MTWLLYEATIAGCFKGSYSLVSGSSDMNFLTYLEIAHTILLTPYFSWKITHHRHHIAHASMERDQLFVPRTRSDLGIPSKGQQLDYEDYFGDTPFLQYLWAEELPKVD
uniref:Delta (12) fatty acid desaturase n=1 Tax=Sparassis latifolia TaxID=1202976 RepID=A0A6B9LS33_9APHY|nr:delta (12) fatty acid desaturase [Sparassis latifolia]